MPSRRILDIFGTNHTCVSLIEMHSKAFFMDERIQLISFRFAASRVRDFKCVD